MGRTSFIVALLLGSVSAASCSSAQEPSGVGSTASGSASATPGSGGLHDSSTGGAAVSGVGGDTNQAFGGTTGGSDASLAGNGGGVLPASGGRASVEGTGGTSDEPGSGGNGGAGTTDPIPEPSGGSGYTEDPHPPATGGTDGTTTDPGDDDTTDPGDDDTTDPGDDDTTDPGDDDTTDPGDDDTTDPGDDDVPDECIPTEMTDVNVIVFGDAEPSGADSEGRMVVGGNANFDGYAIASREEVDCSTWGLVVGGDLTVSGGSVSSGKIAVGGTYTTSSGFTAACGIWEEEPVDFDALEAEMIAYSELMMAYPANGESAVANGTLHLTGTSDKLNVFSVTAADLQNNITLDVPEGSSVIVNVSGTEVVWRDTGFMLPDGLSSCRGEDSEWCRSIMYNMYEATSIELGGIGVQGSILAPYATFSGAGGNVDGQVVVRNLYSGIEFHPYFFSGCLLLPDVEGSV